MGQSSSNHSRTGRIPPAKSALIENAKLSEEKLPDGFKLLHGRGFKETGSPVYMLPNDGSEADRLNGQHYQFRFVAQGSGPSYVLSNAASIVHATPLNHNTSPAGDGGALSARRFCTMQDRPRRGGQNISVPSSKTLRFEPRGLTVSIDPTS
ncbi:hypothetical protein BC938DRAFT_482190 [Jimgerdemannia flammicorona]|uniref:Uncharacterized protein n=1 Tax=Jimgerdemannia flammicorona TaxID=994334 RepID=A0A433QEY8_9FUNG|nr:hypothetical protein BC938DRAFT_482190 [Jimgerdemannia flammicorona]